MQLSTKWLKDYIDPKISADDLAQRLTMSGIEVESMYEVGNDIVFDIEITPNRPDCLNILGLAREVGAITGKIVKFPKIKTTAVRPKKIPITINDKVDCRRYSATLIEGVLVGPSLESYTERLASMGTRSISNCVDVTNFIMFEMGQPLHVFDYDKVAGGKIIVRRAKSDETITTLDGITRKLDPTILIIADREKPIAIAGIMGGKDSQVTSETKNILLEAGHFDMGIVRRACRSLGLRSDSSYRFERNVNGHDTGEAVHRATELILKFAGGKVTARGEINYFKKSLAKPLKLTEEAIVHVLGVKIPLKKAKDILIRLGFKVQGKGKAILVKAPSFRNDIQRVEDLIEEIARIIGFDKLPTSMPKISAQNITIEPRSEEVKQNIYSALLADGLDEIVTLSLTSRKNLTRCLIHHEQGIAVTNPLSIEQEIVRPALLPTVMPVVALNINRGNKNLKFFELGNIFSSSAEKTVLALVLTGRRNDDWRCSRKDHLDFTDIKGSIESIAALLRVTLRWTKDKKKGYDEHACARLEYNGQPIGTVGRLSKEILLNWGIKNEEIYYAEIDVTPWMVMNKKLNHFQILNDYPAITRDVSLAVKIDIEFESIVVLCKKHGGDLLQEVCFIEQYVGDKIQAGLKGLVFSLTYQSSTRTLREDEIKTIHESILSAIIQQIGATIR